MAVAIAFACGDYDRTRALRDGRVRADGIDLTYVPLVPEELFFRQIRYREFEAAELSFANYIILHSRGDCPFVGLPVFPSRFFRHGFLWVNAASGVGRPEELRGRRVGVPEYHLTASVWVRGALEDDHGLHPEDVHWFEGGLNEANRTSRLEVRPTGVRIDPIPEGRTLNDLLVAGELDAVMAARYPAAFEAGHPAVRRLFPDYGRVEREYYRRHRNFPIMHCVVLRRDVYEAHPWVAASLVKALTRAKAIALAEMWDTGALPLALPWSLEQVEELRLLMGSDFWPYGFEANRHDIETLIEYLRRQKLLDREVRAEELFAANTLVEAKL